MAKQKTSYPVKSDFFEEADFLKYCPDNKFIPTFLPPVKRIIAIGDIHGDLDLAIKSFKLAKLIDDNYNWIASPPDTIVVQVGDQIDSCRPTSKKDCRRYKYPDDVMKDTDVLYFFNKMHEKAVVFGGACYSLLGNHELMNAQGKMTYVSYNNSVEFQYTDEKTNTKYQEEDGRIKAYRPGGPIARMLACQRQSVLVIGSTMFVHAGILPALARNLDYLNIDEQSKLKYLNATIRKWLLNRTDEIDKKSVETFLGDATLSPFWTRFYGAIPENVPMDSTECFNSVKEALEIFKINGMIIGHTPQTGKSGINGTCRTNDGRNRLYRVDGGFSKAFEIFGIRKPIQILEILDDSVFNIITDH